MSFALEVDKIKNGVLGRKEYSVPINSLNERVNAYTKEKALENSKEQTISEEEMEK